MPNSPYTATSLQCPTQDQWLRYRRGQSTAQETRAIEAHFTQCALCSEAIETIMSTEPDVLAAQWASLKAPSIASVSSNSSKTNLPTETKKTTIVQRLSTWLVAAVLSGLLIGAYFLYQQSAQQPHRPLAQNTATPKTTEPERVEPANTMNEEVPASPPQSTNNNPLTTKNINRASAPPLNSNIPQAIEKDVSNMIAAKQEAPEMPEKTFVAQDDEAISFNQTDAITPAAAPTPTAAAKENIVAKAYKNEKSLQVSEKKARQTISAAMAPSGSKLYLDGQYAEAIPQLLAMVKTQAPFQMEAIFLADAYNKTGKQQAAKTLLQEIIKENGPFAKKAQQMLDLFE